MPTDVPRILPLSEDDRQAWLRRIEQARDLRKKRQEVWRTCVMTYLGKSLVDAPDRDTVTVNKEFPFVEMKKSQLLFQVPELNLEPRLPGLEQAALMFQGALNHELGPHGADVKTALDEAVWDALVMGIGVTKIGYAAYLGTKDATQPVMDPMTGQPQTDPMTGQPVLQTRTVPTLLKEEFYWRRINPKKLLIPTEFEGGNFDDASWLGFEFEKDLDQAKRDYRLPKDFDTTRGDREESLSGEKDDLTQRDMVTRKVTGVEVWYYAARFDLNEPHPDRFRVLTLIDGHDKPVRHMNSPYQREREDGTLIGMRGNPLHPVTLRTVADCAYPPSDVEMSIHISQELSLSRTQMVRQRETSVPMRWVDRNRVSPDDVEKLKSGVWQGLIPLDGSGLEVLGEVARANFPRENFTFQEVADRDYEEMWALGKNQRGLTEDAARTATEIQEASSAADVRLDAERGRVLTWFTKGGSKFGSLLQLFKNDVSYAQIVGPNGAQALQAWNKDQIQGEFVFKAKPDSALRIDAAARRKQLLDVYNLTANDPNVARVELLKTLFRSYNIDPTLVVVEKLPEKGPEPPKVGISFKGEDLLLTPVLQFLQAQGVKVPPEMLQMAQMAGLIRQTVQQGEQPPQGPAPHGGTAQQVEPLSKHNLRGDGNAPAGISRRSVQ